ncbi:sugar transferase [Halomonas organivorans]|uniref:Lipopolysaccharide/colanic/teichoic acid biosynthesis glycosyltransferase n=1 Tax=Halomonas organivorans TaxID=257772 RepID=A0A7W5BVT5_9GAMM|nr:sugar transferase [Halomonas organivorans]MBB3140050.1 lipopolysaccharide/colanic/teichoic acid biosynthesis glycosyltransferase [Halomonas organivorans]
MKIDKIRVYQKRCFDIVLSSFGLLVVGWLIVVAYLMASWDTRSHGIFKQKRVGRNGHVFMLYKIKTMKNDSVSTSTVTTSRDPRITRVGRLLRKTKVDELPQLWNVLKGDMSFVGPRPDVPGFADRLTGTQSIVLSVRPGITGPATLKYRDEENLLAAQDNPERYNRDVIYPEKVRLNVEYVNNWTFWGDLKLICRTLVG